MGHGHNRYRVKIVTSLLANELTVKNIDNQLTLKEQKIIREWISEYSSLIIGLIDGKYDTWTFGNEVKKERGIKESL